MRGLLHGRNVLLSRRVEFLLRLVQKADLWWRGGSCDFFRLVDLRRRGCECAGYGAAAIAIGLVGGGIKGRLEQVEYSAATASEPDTHRVGRQK